MRTLLWFSPTPILATLAVAATGITRDGVWEKFPLVDTADAKAWSVAESEVQPSAERAKSAPRSWHWHVTVDHFAGEPKYPIGWPRISHAFPAGVARDWAAWDFLHVWVLVETSREALPAEPAGLGLLNPDRANGYNRPLRELRKGEWVELNLPIAQIPRPGDVRQIQFHIAEANYRHGDTLDFYFNDLALARYAEPVLFDLAAENAVVFSDVRRLPVRFQLLGVKPGERAAVTCELRRAGRMVARTTADMERGAQRPVLALSGPSLSPGDYEVWAKVGVREATARLRVVETPWQ